MEMNQEMMPLNLAYHHEQKHHCSARFFSAAQIKTTTLITRCTE